MAAAVKLTFKGVPGVVEELRSLRSDIQTGVAWKASIAAAGTVARKARANARRLFEEGPGHLAAHIALVKMKQEGTRYGYSVGVRAGASRTRKAKKGKATVLRKRGMGVRVIRPDDPFYWWFHEFGFKHAGNGATVGPRPFITPAMISERDKALAAMGRQLKNRLDKIKAGTK